MLKVVTLLYLGGWAMFLGGWAWILFVVFSDSVAWGFFTIICPPAGLLYCIVQGDFSEAKGPFWLMLIGTILIFLMPAITRSMVGA